MVFPETKEIILEAKKQYLAFNNYVEYLDKKVMALQKRKVEAFVETHELEEQRKKEILETAKPRYRYYALLKRNAGVEPSSSRSAEMDFEEIRELKQKLKPSLDKTEEIEAKIKELQLTETRQALLHDVDVAQSMYEDVVWLLIKASIFEEAHSWQDKIIQKRLGDMKKRGTLPLYEGYSRTEDRDTWRKLAEDEFKRRQKKYFENLEKIFKKRKEDQKK